MRAILVSFFVFLGTIVGTMLIFQQWQSLQFESEYYNVIPLSSSSKVQSLNVPNGKTLVPSGSILGVNDIDTITYTYLVDIEKGNNLEVIFSNVTFTKNGLTFIDNDGLLSFSYEVEMSTSTTSKVTVSIRLNMPETEEQYLLISGSSVSFKVNFSQT